MRYVDLGAVNTLNEKNKVEKKPGNWGRPLLFALAVVFAVGGYKAVRREGYKALFNPVSIVTSFVSADDLSETDGRTNILLLGLDRRDGVESGGLTDTMILFSLSRAGENAVMLSLPRDLWVSSYKSGGMKINEIYATDGRDATVKVVEDVAGVPVHYYAVIDFKAFTKAIEILGGVKVYVETSFEDERYPVEGMENAEPEESRYKKVSFQAGLLEMDSETALIFARSRKGNNGEGTDFARGRRQQKVILAIRDKILSLETLSNPVKIKELYDTYNTYVDTNIGLAESQRLYEIGSGVEPGKIKSLVLNDRSPEEEGGLLYEPEDKSLYRGAYVLIPRAGDYSQIRAYVQKILFGE
ncbi:LCP family protein [candidate division WWE3 bacterium]|nr:LCP family protein [candidate division WWE3 bacterium]